MDIIYQFSLFSIKSFLCKFLIIILMFILFYKIKLFYYFDTCILWRAQHTHTHTTPVKELIKKFFFSSTIPQNKHTHKKFSTHFGLNASNTKKKKMENKFQNFSFAWRINWTDVSDSSTENFAAFLDVVLSIFFIIFFKKKTEKKFGKSFIFVFLKANLTPNKILFILHIKYGNLWVMSKSLNAFVVKANILFRIF